ncbi:MAG: exodeoxyribonuclease VII large subunit [Candidatus Nomurabacteria bacterium]|nr:exodeoxyribonuclease VII large subunit [Candidatus Nomurabacteria bacterium]
MENQPIFSVSEAMAVVNQTLEYAFPFIQVEGEVANFKVGSGKWVFFDLKDSEASLRCFMPAWNLRTAVEDGMRVAVVAKPRLSKYGFSLNIEAIKPVGEGDIKKSFELLKKKLTAEGLFAPERKRPLPDLPSRIGVISSVEAAGYKDFIKIIGARFGVSEITVADTAVQGDSAPDQIMAAIAAFNESADPPEVIVILRGGGSRDDLLAFDDEPLVRAIAGSRVPTLVGVGHEIDVTLADLAADVRASTPSNAAEILLPDKREIIKSLSHKLEQSQVKLENNLQRKIDEIVQNLAEMRLKTEHSLVRAENLFGSLDLALEQLNPARILQRGYALVRRESGEILRAAPTVGEKLQIETKNSTFRVKTVDILS